MSLRISRFLSHWLSLAMSGAVGLLIATTASGAGPVVNEVRIDFNDPAFDVEESLYMSDICGFPVTADLSGFMHIIRFDGEGPRSVYRIATFHIGVTYTNPVTGSQVHLSDSGPDRIVIRDGRAYIVVSGNAPRYGFSGLMVIDMDAEQIVRLVGKERPDAYELVCGQLAQ